MTRVPAARSSPYWTRREIVRGAGVGLAAWATGCEGNAVPGPTPPPIYALPEVKRNPNYGLDRAVTPPEIARSHVTYRELGDSPAAIEAAAAALQIRDWSVTVSSSAGTLREIPVQELVNSMPLEERTYRFRALDGTAKAIPWLGFPLRALLDTLDIPTEAAWAAFESGAGAPAYREALRLDEARHDLTLLAVGAWGRELSPVFGGPIRLVVPWKYGHKSVKAVRRIHLLDAPPTPDAERARWGGPWGNVDPSRPGPHGSQASERVLPARERIPTLPYNGYGALVASMYTGETPAHP